MRRAKTGCITCRIRKIKCDESKPSCQRCVSTGRTCDGYSTLAFSGLDLVAASHGQTEMPVRQIAPLNGRPGLIPRLLSSATFQNVAEKRYFQFFQKCTVLGTNLYLNSRFWDRLVLQGCEAEPAIKHAVLALAAFHNSVIPQNDSGVAQKHLEFAGKHYQLALGEAKRLVVQSSNRQFDRVLIVCMLFVLYEGLQGNYKASQSHMHAGRAIITHARQDGLHMSRRKSANEILETFARLDVFASAFSDGAAPYRYTVNDLSRTVPELLLSPFATVNEAQSSLVDLLRWILVLGNYIHFGKVDGKLATTELGSLWSECGKHLGTWRQSWEELLGRGQEEGSNPQTDMIELWYTTAGAMFDSGLTDLEMSYDSLHTEFTRIVELSERLTSELGRNHNLASLCLDLGFLMPNFFCAIRCRDPPLRRRALRILKACPRREGIWESFAAAEIAIRWMDIEEEGLEDLQIAEQIPEWKRISTVQPRIDLEHSSAELRFTLSSTAGVDKNVRTETVKWTS